MTPSNRRTQESVDLIALDLIPACPGCGDLCHPTLTVCDGCGARLFPSNSNGVGRSDLDGTSAADAEEVSLAMTPHCTCHGRGLCTVCVLDEYDRGPGRAIEMTVAALERKPADLRTVKP